jgi:hypothetical protein
VFNLPKLNRGFVFDIPGYIDRLMRSTDENPFLIITVMGSEDFLQLSGSGGTVQLDFPMVTQRQQSLETTIRTVAASSNLTIIENYGTDGTLFLDIDLSGAAPAMAAICSKMLREVFSVSGTTELLFEQHGLAAGD